MSNTSKSNPILADLRAAGDDWTVQDSLDSIWDMSGDSLTWECTPEQSAFAERVLTRMLAVAAVGDPLATARQALAAHDNPAIQILGRDGFPLIGSVERAEYVIAALRPLAEPATGETVEQLAMRVYMEVHSFPWLVHGDAMRDLIARGIRAGVQAAREGWEPAGA